MNIGGIYKVFSNGKLISKTHNTITDDGFNLVQNWFVNKSANKLSKINIQDTKYMNIIYYRNDQFEPHGFSSVDSVFYGYDNAKYVATSSKDSYLEVDFKRSDSSNSSSTYFLQPITAIGIDAVTVKKSESDTTSQLYNSNLSVTVSESINSITEHDVQDFSISVPLKNFSFNKRADGNIENIFYFRNSLNVSTIRLNFNSFTNSSNLFDYRIYSINFYKDNEYVLPPAYMTLYNSDKTLTKQMKIDSISKSNTNSHSVLFVSSFSQQSIPFSVKYVSLDFYEKDQYDSVVEKSFSIAAFDEQWEQQSHTTIEIQYELFLSNNS